MAKQVKKIATRQDDLRLISRTLRCGGVEGGVCATTLASRVMV